MGKRARKRLASFPVPSMLERAPQAPSFVTTGSSSLPHSVSSYTWAAAGGGSLRRWTTPALLELAKALGEDVGARLWQAVARWT